MIKIDLVIKEPKWKLHKQINRAHISKTLKMIFQALNYKTNKNIGISILLTNNIEMQRLNKQFLNKDKPTNVLSFPHYHQEELEHQIRDNSEIFLGDIAFSYELIYTESKHENKSFIDHYTHLLVHGALHLMGYDHITDEDTKAMINLEVEILQKLHIKNPY